jgi:GlpG protein
MRVIETSLEEDLSLFSRYLWQESIPHRIFEERGLQVLEVAQTDNVAAVRNAYSAWRNGLLVLQKVDPVVAPRKRFFETLWRGFRMCPVLSGLLLLAIAIFPSALPLTRGEITPIAGYLTIVDLESTFRSDLATVLSTTEPWRWLTPIFLHFSVLHLVFNCVVVLELGRRIEVAVGPGRFLLLIAGIGIASNLAQVAWDSYPVFGGLSGVAYGFLGFLLVMQKRFPDNARFALPMGFAASLLIFLVVFSTGVTEFFGLNVANAAHWSGLAAGALAGLVMGVTRRAGA